MRPEPMPTPTDWMDLQEMHLVQVQAVSTHPDPGRCGWPTQWRRMEIVRNINRKKLFAAPYRRRLLKWNSVLWSAEWLVFLRLKEFIWHFESQRIRMVWKPSIKVKSVRTIVAGATASVHLIPNINREKQKRMPVCRSSLRIPELWQYIIRRVRRSLNST